MLRLIWPGLLDPPEVLIFSVLCPQTRHKFLCFIFPAVLAEESVCATSSKKIRPDDRHLSHTQQIASGIIVYPDSALLQLYCVLKEVDPGSGQGESHSFLFSSLCVCTWKLGGHPPVFSRPTGSCSWDPVFDPPLSKLLIRNIGSIDKLIVEPGRRFAEVFLTRKTVNIHVHFVHARVFRR